MHGFTFGDSLDEHKRSKWIDFKARLSKVANDYRESSWLQFFFLCAYQGKPDQ